MPSHPKSRLPLLSLLAGALVCAATLPTSAQNLQYLGSQSWSTQDGLPQNSVHGIAQTRDGFLWAATESGLVRFDGARFEVFNHRTDPAFTSDDLCCLVAGHDNGLWIGTSDGLLHLYRGRFTHSPTGLRSSAILGLTPQPDGSLNIVTSAGAAHWPTGDDPAIPASTPRDGPTWVGTNSGLVVVDSAKHTATPIPEFKGSSILSIFQDQEGSHWIGTESSGLHLLRQLKFRGIPALAGKPITSVAQTTSGATWVGTRDDGIYRVINGVADQPIPTHSLTSGVILCLQPASDGGLWVGTPDGLNHIDTRNTIRQITSANGLPDDYIRSLMPAPDASVWVGTRHGFVHLHDAHAEILASTDGLGGDLIGAMLLDPSGLWVATSGGLSHISPDEPIKNFTTHDGLATPIVTALSLDASGRLWVATDDGTFATFDGRRFHPLFNLVRDANGSSNIQAITIDASGSLWVRMDRQILRIASPQLQACLKRSPCGLEDDLVIRYGPADGLHNDEVVPGATAIPWMSSNGELWFPTRSGVAITQTNASPAPSAVPTVIERLSVDDVSIDILHGDPQLPFGPQRLTMEYAGLSFLAPTGMHYRYRLEGFDKQWTEAGNRRSATYTNLAPGPYTFEVQARNNDGGWNLTGAQLRFRIIPPIYRRWWFLLLLTMLAAAAAFGLYLLRLRHLRNQFDIVLAERNRMAREIHDTLTQDFVSTSLQLDLVAQQLNRGHVDKAIEQVRQARQLVTEGLAEARRSIWELRANNSQDTLPTRLNRIAQHEAFTTLHPEVQVRGAYRVLDHRVEREILRVANEALRNAMKHANPQRVTLDLFYSSEALLLTVKDDGIGFDVDKALRREGHYGLLGMRERASIIDATLEILSDPGHGTTILLRVPLVHTHLPEAK